MRKFKVFINHLLLVGFLFPQAANALHYLVQSHSAHIHSGEIYEVAAPTYEYHNCDYLFHSLKYYNPSEANLEFAVFEAPQKKEDHFYSGDFKELAFHYSLRGPPFMPA
jgi:hypothetical protein